MRIPSSILRAHYYLPEQFSPTSPTVLSGAPPQNQLLRLRPGLPPLLVIPAKTET
jgi:hypothetical protein